MSDNLTINDCINKIKLLQIDFSERLSKINIENKKSYKKLLIVNNKIKEFQNKFNNFEKKNIFRTSRTRV